jgi:hypothetical protein
VTTDDVASNTIERRLLNVRPSSCSHRASCAETITGYPDLLSVTGRVIVRVCGSYLHLLRKSSATGGMSRSTVLHNWEEFISISRSWWQIAARTNCVGPPLSDEDVLLPSDEDESSSSNSIACTKILRISSAGRRKSGEARTFLRRRR